MLRNSQASLEAQRDTRSVGRLDLVAFVAPLRSIRARVGCLRNNGIDVVRRVTSRAQVLLSRGAAGNGLCVRLSKDVLLFVSAAAERVVDKSIVVHARACVGCLLSVRCDIFVVARVFVVFVSGFFSFARRHALRSFFS